jgi:hypothetical protein
MSVQDTRFMTDILIAPARLNNQNISNAGLRNDFPSFVIERSVPN